MATEQEGVSPATAGGASAPIPEVPPHPGYVDNAVAGALTDMYGFLPLDVRYSAAAAARAVVECWTRSRPVSDVDILPADGPEPSESEPGKLRTIANALHAMLGEGDCVEHTVTLGHVWYLVRLVEGHLDVISDRNRRGPQEPDPCDAEIERLREELRQREQRGFDAYAELLNPIRAVFGKSPVTASHYRELRDGITALIGRLNAKESIKDKALTERDEAREEWKRADAEVTRLKREADELPKQYGDLVNRILEAYDTPVRVDMATFDQLAGELNDLIENRKVELYELNKARRRRTDAEAERDRLRAELDLIGEQAVEGYIAVQNKRVCPCKSRCDYNVLEDRCSDRCRCDLGPAKPAEPRRWRKGDPEPEIGVTVQRGQYRYTRTEDGWRLHIDIPIYAPWEWIVAAGEVVEVVDTDGQ